jgi:hypothetical protein
MMFLRLRVALLAAVLALAGVFGGAAPALASDYWCDVDPPVVIFTPEGRVRIVYVVNGGPVLYLPQLVLPEISYDVDPAGPDMTKVELNVKVSRGLLGAGFDVRSQVWSGPAGTGTLLSTVYARAGETLRHTFRLNVD